MRGSGLTGAQTGSYLQSPNEARAFPGPKRGTRGTQSLLRAASDLPLQNINRLGKVRDAYVFSQQGMSLLDGLVHLPCHAAIAEVPGGAGAQFADVLRLGKIHFEQASDTRCQWQQV